MMTRQQMYMACGDGLGTVGLAIIIFWWQKFPSAWPGEWLYVGTGLIAIASALHIPYTEEKKPYYQIAIASSLIFVVITIYGLILT